MRTIVAAPLDVNIGEEIQPRHHCFVGSTKTGLDQALPVDLQALRRDITEIEPIMPTVQYQ